MPGKERELWGAFHEDAHLISEGQSSLHGLLKPVNLGPGFSRERGQPVPWGKTDPAYSTGLFKVKLCSGSSQRSQTYWRTGGLCCEAVSMLWDGVRLTD